MTGIVNAIQSVLSLFSAAGAGALAMAGSIIPTYLCIYTFVVSIVRLIGAERVQGVLHKVVKIPLLRWTIVPAFLLTFVPGIGGYVLAQQMLDEDQKPAYSDTSLTYLHPSMGIFPHVHAAEYFVYGGLAAGYAAAGGTPANFALRALLSALVVMAIRGFTTDTLYAWMKKRTQAANPS
jgi:PTS system glucitol/sorbitol-specific IIC component